MRLSSSNFLKFDHEAIQVKISRAKQTLVHAYQWQLLVLALIISDFLAVGLAFRAGYFVRFEMSIPLFKLDVVPDLQYYLQVIYFVIPGWLVIYAFLGLYQRSNVLFGTKEYSMVFSGTLTSILLVIVAGFLGPEFVVARGWVIASWFFAFLFTCLGRFVARRIVRTARKKGFYLASALVVGMNEEGQLLAEQLGEWQYSGLNVLGFVDAKESPDNQPVYKNLYRLGGMSELDALIKKYGVDELVIATSAVSREDLLRVFQKYGVNTQVNLRLSSGLYEIITTGLEVSEVSGVPLVKVNKVRLKGIDQMLKGLLDYSLAVIALIVFSPAMMIIALAVKLTSKGPIIHRRKVMGVNGKTFDAFKFRSMRVNGEEILAQHPELKAELERNHKLKDDPRITKIGKFIRKYSLDELPQIFNVLRGEMSIVGPRMISPAEMDEYKKWGINLLTIRPGITGLWQVSGRSDVSYDERVRMDMFYIRNWTVWMDIQLIVRTPGAVFKGRGAY